MRIVFLLLLLSPAANASDSNCADFLVKLGKSVWDSPKCVVGLTTAIACGVLAYQQIFQEAEAFTSDFHSSSCAGGCLLAPDFNDHRGINELVNFTLSNAQQYCAISDLAMQEWYERLTGSFEFVSKRFMKCQSNWKNLPLMYCPLEIQIERSDSLITFVSSWYFDYYQNQSQGKISYDFVPAP
jgi:hypothetical protein